MQAFRLGRYPIHFHMMGQVRIITVLIDIKLRFGSCLPDRCSDILVD